MKITQQQLNANLQQKLAPIYLLSSDETLLLQEACTAICETAKSSGFTEKQTFYVESGFNWESFLAANSNLSLFAESTLVEMHFNSKITEVGSKILQAYAAKPATDKILLILTGKLDAAIQKTAWFKAIDTHGVILQLWPIDARQMPSWISQRLLRAGLKTDAAGIKLLVEHSEGNLLAAQQEIEKLSLIYGEKFAYSQQSGIPARRRGSEREECIRSYMTHASDDANNAGNLSAKSISADAILAVVTNNSKFNIYNFVDAFLQNEKSQALKILANLKSEGIDPVLILWAVTRELRSLIGIATTAKTGSTLDAALEAHRVWSTRKAIVKKMLQLHCLNDLNSILQKSASLDLIIKGAKDGNFWIECERMIVFGSAKPINAG